PRLNSTRAQQRADELIGRLRQRQHELEQERQISALPPAIMGGAIIVPIGLLHKLLGPPEGQVTIVDPVARKRIERLAMDAVMAHERELGFEPCDVGDEKLGWDVESKDSAGGPTRFIEVK